MDQLFKTFKGLMLLAVILIILGLIFYNYHILIGSIIMFFGALVATFAIFSRN